MADSTDAAAIREDGTHVLAEMVAAAPHTLALWIHKQCDRDSCNQ